MGHERNQQRTARQKIRDAGGYVVTLNPTNGDGEPDLVACVGGRALVVELKQPGENPSRSQQVRLSLWQQAGAIVGVARTPADLDRLIAQARDASLLQPRRVVDSPPPGQEPLAT